MPIKYRYLVNGFSSRRMFATEESIWDPDLKTCVVQRIINVPSRMAGAVFGFLPTAYGTKRSMWMHIPDYMNWDTSKSPLEEWLRHPDSGLKGFRYFPPDCLPIERQATFADK